MATVLRFYVTEQVARLQKESCHLPKTGGRRGVAALSPLTLIAIEE